MNRRDFLRILLASAVAEAVDVEQLLWVPKPIITVPGGVSLSRSITMDDILALQLEMMSQRIRSLFEKDDIFYKLIKP